MPCLLPQSFAKHRFERISFFEADAADWIHEVLTKIMSIWFAETTPEQINQLAPGTIVECIGIEFTEVGPDFLKARMPVDERTIQPARILHGGASVVLAETLGSVAAYLCIDPQKKTAVGLDINANHVCSAGDGDVVGTVTPLHLGNSTHIWQIIINDKHERLVCIARITMAILDQKV